MLSAILGEHNPRRTTNVFENDRGKLRVAAEVSKTPPRKSWHSLIPSVGFKWWCLCGVYNPIEAEVECVHDSEVYAEARP